MRRTNDEYFLQLETYMPAFCCFSNISFNSLAKKAQTKHY